MIRLILIGLVVAIVLLILLRRKQPPPPLLDEIRPIDREDPAGQIIGEEQKVFPESSPERDTTKNE